MRAVIYARYSSENQQDSSIDDQVRLCRARLEREGWSCEEIYTDRAVSGASRFRPRYQQMLLDGRSGLFDVIVAESLDRLSRDQEDIAALYKQAGFQGYKLLTLVDGDITELHVGLKGTMNALYLKDLAQKTRRGLEGRVLQGRSGGGKCYGYDVVDERGPDGERVPGGRKINPSQAQIVRRVFIEFAAGRSPRAIASDLNRGRVPGPGGGTWGPSTINGNKDRGTGILNNELYVGRLVWNRLRYVKDPNTGKRLSRQNPREAWIIRDVPGLRLIDQSLWDAVKQRQAELTRNTRPDVQAPKPFWARTRPKYLLSGLMKCGACGSSFVKISQSHFGCAAARNKGPAVCTNLLAVRRDVLEAHVLDGLRHGLMAPDLFKVFAQEFVAEVNRARREDSADRTAAEAELRKAERKIRRALDILLDSTDEPAALVAELKTLEARKAELLIALEPSKEEPPLLHPNLAELYRQKVEALQGILEDPNTQLQAFEIIRSLIEEVRLQPGNGQLQIEIRGELAGILQLCAAGKRKPGQENLAGLAEQIKMVAGAGFEPATFRL